MINELPMPCALWGVCALGGRGIAVPACAARPSLGGCGRAVRRVCKVHGV